WAPPPTTRTPTPPTTRSPSPRCSRARRSTPPATACTTCSARPSCGSPAPPTARPTPRCSRT
ncbi:MAG: hypothetical protein AVDCRST_MAG85-1897, partial [uncultured Solirubrobacteraceae bacterium]